ncbi:MAG: cellulase [Ruminococcaceae bacterium]|nr:cellulase [Oscillospiraceae bacterium]
MTIKEKTRALFGFDGPFAIAMWDFSWLERRWSGGGFENWDTALLELKERGYDAVRIDPYPHLFAVDPHKEWLMPPEWNQNSWGSPMLTKITVHDALRDFLSACKKYGIRVGLSSWYRKDMDNVHLKIKTPRDHANIWTELLHRIDGWGMADTILYVDFCNEWPFDIWAPFFTDIHGKVEYFDSTSVEWMRETVRIFKDSYPAVPVTFSCCTNFGDDAPDISFLDFMEVHTWMVSFTDYYARVGYKYERFEDTGYVKMAFDGERIYREDKDYFDSALVSGIERIGRWAKKRNMPFVTTECWSVIDYKDGPMLNWDWILELNELGVKTATKTGAYAGIATSNFCAPQFVGMWREAEWHRRMCDIIHESAKEIK